MFGSLFGSFSNVRVPFVWTGGDYKNGPHYENPLSETGSQKPKSLNRKSSSKRWSV